MIAIRPQRLVPATRTADNDATVASTGAPGSVRELLHGIRGMQRLPITGVQLIDAGKRIPFVSANGRYVFTGPAWDLWHGARLRTLEEGGRLAWRVDLKRLRRDPAALGALDRGHGKEDVAVFIDPRCAHCRRLLERLADLTGRYRFRRVPLPVLGSDSEAAAVRLNCLAERDPAAAREALLAGRVEALSDAADSCGQAPAQPTLVTARRLRIRGMPYRIAADQRLHQGIPADLKAWWEDDE